MTLFTGGICDWTQGSPNEWDDTTAATAWTPLGNGWNGNKPFSPTPTSPPTLPCGHRDYCVRVKAERNNDSNNHLVWGSWTSLGNGNDQSSFTFGGYPSGNACTQPCATNYPGDGDYLGADRGATSTTRSAVHVEPDRRQAVLLRDRGDRPDVPARDRLRVHPGAGLRAADGQPPRPPMPTRTPSTTGRCSRHAGQRWSGCRRSDRPGRGVSTTRRTSSSTPTRRPDQPGERLQHNQPAHVPVDAGRRSLLVHPDGHRAEHSALASHRRVVVHQQHHLPGR